LEQIHRQFLTGWDDAKSGSFETSAARAPFAVL
jgi:hypothetical protein